MAGLNLGTLFSTLTTPAAQQAVAAAFGLASQQIGATSAAHGQVSAYTQAMKLAAIRKNADAVIAQATALETLPSVPITIASLAGDIVTSAKAVPPDFASIVAAVGEIDALNTASSATSSLAGQLSAAASHLTGLAAAGA